MSETIISVQDLSKSFGDHEVLRKIDMDVHVGEIICIVGSSGSGKSTLLRCINRLERQTSGKVMFYGKEVRDVQREINEYRSKVGMVFQSFNLFNNMTVLENCMLCTRKVLHLPKEEAFDRAITHLKAVGMAPYIHAKPSQLSGGQKQRVAIARAILRKSPIIILDEATASVDVETERQIQNAISRIAGTRTILAIAHRLSTIRNADLILVIEDGRVAERGTHEELMAKKGYYYQMQLAQSEGQTAG